MSLYVIMEGAGPLSVMLEGDSRGSPGCCPPVFLQLPLISFKPHVTTIFSLSCLLSFKRELKKKEHPPPQRSSASWEGGTMEDSTTYPFFFSSELCSISLSGKGRQRKKAQNFDPWGGEAEVDLHY